jgi:hypothetical protein
MTKHKFFKIIIAIIVAFSIFMLISNSVFAYHEVNLTAFDNYKDKSDASNITYNVIGSAINIVQIVAAGVAIIMLIALAIQWIYASPDRQAAIKAKAVRHYIVGAILIFSSVGLLELVKKFATANIRNQIS